MGNAERIIMTREAKESFDRIEEVGEDEIENDAVLRERAEERR